MNTLPLARFLASHHVAATFFVVREWVDKVSEEPGEGAHRFATGYAHLPVLADLVALGHRLGNHTVHHVLLGGATASTVRAELEENQRGLDPFQTNELRLFRVPGGVWSEGAADVVAAAPTLRELTGPVRWDIDRKDWEGSLYCRSEDPARECEPAAPGHASRVRAAVTARRYLDTIETEGHGIVLFHDRVGDVGSDYALRVAENVVPELEARGFVFAAPILAFSRFRVRTLDPGTLAKTLRGDLNGDGREDACASTDEGVRCSLSGPGGPLASSLWLPRVRPDASAWLDGALSLTDANGDGRVDLCSVRHGVVACAFAP